MLTNVFEIMPKGQNVKGTLNPITAEEANNPLRTADQ